MNFISFGGYHALRQNQAQKCSLSRARFLTITTEILHTELLSVSTLRFSRPNGELQTHHDPDLVLKKITDFTLVLC